MVWTVTVTRMTDTRAMLLQAAVVGELPRIHVCKDALELSDALASEMERAHDPTPVMRWIETPRFYDYWKACFEGSGGAMGNPPRPRPCLYMDASRRYTLATVLTVCTRE